MPLSPSDIDRLIRAIDRNTAASLAAAVSALAYNKPSIQPTTAMKGAVRSSFEEFLKEVQLKS